MIPAADCPLCPRLAAYRFENRSKEADWHNGPVPSFGSTQAAVLIVGLAPGLRGANRTGRPFTGDFAGVLLFSTLVQCGFAVGDYDARADDGLHLCGCRITNAVRCVPPQNLPTPSEARTCNQFLAFEIAAMPSLKAILALGTLSHEMSLRALGVKPSKHKFLHGAVHEIRPGFSLVNSYHVSRYNTSTRRLTPEMFLTAIRTLRNTVDASD